MELAANPRFGYCCVGLVDWNMMWSDALQDGVAASCLILHMPHLMMLLVQVLIVQHGGAAFSTVPLTAGQWAGCVGLGASALLVRRALLPLPAPAPPPPHAP
jgi:hypothetical protein